MTDIRRVERPCCPIPIENSINKNPLSNARYFKPNRPSSKALPLRHVGTSGRAA